MSKRVIFVTGASTAQSKHFIKESGLLFLNHNAFLSTNSNTSSFHHKTCPDISSQLIIIWKTSACQIRVTWRNRPETWRNKQTVTSQRREPKIIILSKSAWLLFICQTLITILLWNLRDFCSFECLKRCHKTRQSFYMMNRFNFGFYSHSSIDTTQTERDFDFDLRNVFRLYFPRLYSARRVYFDLRELKCVILCCMYVSLLMLTELTSTSTTTPHNPENSSTNTH